MEDDSKMNALLKDLSCKLKMPEEIETGKEKDEILKVLNSIASLSKTATDTSNFNITALLSLLKCKSPELKSEAAKVIAETSKIDEGRKLCTNEELIKILIDLLNEDCVGVLIQCCRALGNICCENDKARVILNSCEALKRIMSILERFANELTLCTVALGLILNYLIDNFDLHKQAMDLDVVGRMSTILNADPKSESSRNALLILSILSDSEFKVVTEDVANPLKTILESGESELLSICLELLQTQSEHDSVKILLAKSGICALLVQIGPNWGDKDLLRVACNVIVLVLTGDESMNYLYANGEGSVYKDILLWLENNDKDLRVTSVLCLGNFARTDAHCTTIVNQGVHRELLKLLKVSNDDIRFQHALLSSLRNLVIPRSNKKVMLDDGLLSELSPLIIIPTYPIVFKLLGTLRIVIDGQREAAITLGRNNDLIKKTVEFCDIEDHAGVQGEANRLLAWIINNSRDKETAKVLIKEGALKPLIEMLSSSHSLMRNEALISLSIISAMSLEETESILLGNKIEERLVTFFEENTEEAMIKNAVGLLKSIIQSDKVRETLKNSKLKQKIEALKVTGKEEVQQLIQSLS